MGDWSRQFEQTYHVFAPEDLRAWLDDGLWREPIGAEFCQPLSPAQLLAPTREQIWAGMTPPDSLPIIGNNYGDWLCLRFGLDNTITEVIRWSHAGGDWTPYGESLSEALLFDAAMRVTAPRRPEFTEPEPPDAQRFGAAQWAWRQLANLKPTSRLEELDAFWRPANRSHWEQRGPELFRWLAEADISVVPCAAELSLAALKNPLKSLATPQLAQSLGQKWEPDFVRWLLDAEQLPGSLARQLAAHWNLTEASLGKQDWAEAERWAVTVLNQRPDLAWAGDIAGWAAERRGDKDEAKRRYARGCLASAFTDDAVRFRTQWYPPQFAKFSIYRLCHLMEPASAATEMQLDGPRVDYLDMASRCEESSLRNEVTRFWQAAADRAAEAGKHDEQCRALIAAGWDVGMDDFAAYEPLLAEIQGAAEAAGGRALAAVAKAQRQAN